MICKSCEVRKAVPGEKYCTPCQDHIREMVDEIEAKRQYDRTMDEERG